MEMIVAPNIDVVKRDILIGFATNLGNGLSGVLVVRNLSQSLVLLAITTRVVGTPQMVFINPITTTHVNRIADQPLMNSMAAKRYRSANVAIQ
jgi:hypothetical protein